MLDAGAGASKYRQAFAHCRYETQDFCQYQGKLVNYLQPIDYVCEITKIPLADRSLDAVLCTEVLEHVVDPMAVLAEFQRLLKPGGLLLLTAPHSTQLHMEPYHYYGGFTHYWYRHWLPKFGFEVRSITPQGGPGRAAVSFMQGILHELANVGIYSQRNAARAVVWGQNVAKNPFSLPVRLGIAQTGPAAGSESDLHRHDGGGHEGELTAVRGLGRSGLSRLGLQLVLLIFSSFNRQSPD